MSHGITIVELLLVIALIAIIGATATPFASRFVLQLHFSTTTDKLISTINKAQSYAMDSKLGQTWGVCTANNQISLYAGTCNNPIVLESFTIPSTVQITGLTDTTFTQRGEPSQPLAIAITTVQSSTIIAVNQAGGVTQN